MKNWIACLGALLLAGCSHHIIDMGGGRYSISDTSVHGAAAAREGAAESASDYCATLKKKPDIESFQDDGSSSSAVFRCQ